ncbi:RNA-directed DNA polymerase (Reverse transcriptase) [Micromonospora sp. WMMD718]|nr:MULTISPECIES: RNA-directed DNA polymerase (Reverse transcriptase) [unclassified Micromonospora]MDG4751307.1 RNA-directed DNA polymerase (Reverse transcriptase) [Micromonospora sp. WMMD718]
MIVGGGIVPAVQASPTIAQRTRPAQPRAHSLMPFLVDLPHLVAAARLGMRRAAAPGADGLTWAGYRHGLRARLGELSDRLRAGTWEPGPLRHIEITSYTGKVFPAVIPTVEDRIVHRAMRRAVEPILERHVLADWVSAYRPRRNRITALRQAEQHLAAGRQWVADVDVAGASAGGSSEQFVDWLAVHVADGSFLRLFRRAVEALPTPLVPGSGLWPVLFHLRLSQVDALLADWPIVRFADNYLIFAADELGAVAAFDALTAALATVQMQPHPRKSRIRPPHQANTEDLFLIDG